MESKVINETDVKNIMTKIITEEVSKVKREDFNRVQYKIEELQNSLNDTYRELRKLEDSIPSSLKTISNGRISGISGNLSNAQRLITQLKDKIKQYKKSVYNQPIEEKKI